MTPDTIITATMLRKLGACSNQVAKFKALFPDGTKVTRALCAKHAADFDWSWAARNLLTPKAYADYNAKRAPLWADYEAKLAPLRADYEAQCAPLWADYEAKLAPLFADAFLAQTDLEA